MILIKKEKNVLALSFGKIDKYEYLTGKKILPLDQHRLTHFQLMLHCYIHWKHQNPRSFLVFSGGIEEEYWLKMG